MAWIAKADGYIYWYNERWYAYTDTTPEQMEGWGWESVHDPKVLPKVLEQWKASIATGQMFDMEFPLRGADGIFHPFLTRVLPLKDAEGHIIQWFGTNTDVTERKRVGDALRAERNFSNAMLDTTGALVCVLDCDGRIVRFNRACEKKTGHTSSEVMGRIFWDFLLTEDEKSGVIDKFKLLEAGQFPLDYENHWVARNGELVLVSWSNTIVLDQDGEIEFIIATGMDITERKRAEEALKKAHDNLEVKVKERTAELEDANKSLKESEKRLAEAQKMAHTGNWVWDIATDKEYWSDELHRIFKRDPQEAAPSYSEYLNYVHPDDRDYADNAFKGTINGKPYEIDHKIILDGEERTVHIRAEVVFNDKNIPIQTKGIVQDITESKRAEEKIQSLANIVESSEDAIGTLSLDGIITSWNKGAEQIYGYSAE